MWVFQHECQDIVVCVASHKDVAHGILFFIPGLKFKITPLLLIKALRWCWATGHVLIASPTALANTKLAETVILLTHHNRGGSQGVILNHPATVSGDSSDSAHFLGCSREVWGETSKPN
jgi:Uncharacterized ACR, COG1678